MDRAGAMQRALVEDHVNVKDSLRHTERLKERARENFEIIERENQEETQAVERQIRDMEALLMKM
jgi:hypothetical protein